jgi:hypothetical protein
VAWGDFLEFLELFFNRERWYGRLLNFQNYFLMEKYDVAGGEYRCAEGRQAWDGGERERRQWVELRWRDALAREEVKWRHGLVVGRVAKLEMTFFISVEGGSQAVREGWAAVVVQI